MSQAAAAAENTTSALDEAAEMVACGLAQLSELAGIGMAFARALGRIAEAAIEAAPEGEAPEVTPQLSDAALAFSRISRAVRMTVGLQSRILRDRQARADRLAAEKAVKDAEEAEMLHERRVKGNLRRAMTRFIVQTAIEAEERDDEDWDRLVEGLDERLGQLGEDGLAFEHIHVKDTAYAIAKDLGLDPGEDWWREKWLIDPPPAAAAAGGGGPRSGGGGYTEPTGSGAASATPP
jgi:hypothetical protein